MVSVDAARRASPLTRPTPATPRSSYHPRLCPPSAPVTAGAMRASRQGTRTTPPTGVGLPKMGHAHAGSHAPESPPRRSADQQHVEVRAQRGEAAAPQLATPQRRGQVVDRAAPAAAKPEPAAPCVGVDVQARRVVVVQRAADLARPADRLPGQPLDVELRREDVEPRDVVCGAGRAVLIAGLSRPSRAALPPPRARRGRLGARPPGRWG